MATASVNRAVVVGGALVHVGGSLIHVGGSLVLATFNCWLWTKL